MAVQELDSDCSGTLGYKKLCAQLRRFPYEPPIHLTTCDFEVITQVMIRNPT